MTDRERRAAAVLEAWGSAIRGDWSEIDGRSCKAQLAEISAYLRGETDVLTAGLVGVCYCDQGYSDTEATPHWHTPHGGWAANPCPVCAVDVPEVEGKVTG